MFKLLPEVGSNEVEKEREEEREEDAPSQQSANVRAIIIMLSVSCAWESLASPEAAAQESASRKRREDGRRERGISRKRFNREGEGRMQQMKEWRKKPSRLLRLMLVATGNHFALFICRTQAHTSHTAEGR